MVGKLTSLSNSPKGNESMEPSERARKQLMYRDDYETTNPKCKGVTASAAEISNDSGTEGTVMAYEGEQMLLVQDADATTQTVYYEFGQNKTDKITLDVWFWKNSDLAAMELIAECYDNTTVETYKLKFLESGMKLQYWTSAGAYADATGGALDLADDTWNHIRLTIDPANSEYISCQLNGSWVSLSGTACESAADAVTEGKNTFTIGITTGANNKAAYLDDFRIYLNE
jgi:hypothetical protein